jgi:transaldolase/glucose-6-phosphate isomerase
MPPATMDNFRDHGRVRNSIVEGLEEAELSLKKLSGLGVDLQGLTEKLQKDGAESFSASYKKLISALENKAKTILSGESAGQVLNLGGYQKSVDKRLEHFRKIDFIRRLGQKDATLWSDKAQPETANRLGWFCLPEEMRGRIGIFKSFAENIRKEGFKHVVLLGMGGSSLAAEVFSRTFGNSPAFPELIVLDSTHPDAVKSVEELVNLEKTLFIVASKSGSTLEPLSFFAYFHSKLSEIKSDAGSNFIAITDPKTSLAELAREKGFRKTFYAQTDIGGRYSALTVFGVVPAALIGVNVRRLLDRAWIAKEGCAVCVPEKENKGLLLGAALGELVLAGRNKVTFFTPDYLKSFPDWLEQLIAESTGKDGKGLVPVPGEPLIRPELYSKDRVFVAFSKLGEEDGGIEKLLDGLEKLGHPTIRISLSDKYDIGQEIFKWELAIASAGAVLGIHPFNQPDVELAKKLAKAEMEKGGEDEIDIMDGKVHKQDLEDWISLARKKDYACIMAYLNPLEETTGDVWVRPEIFTFHRAAA